MNEGEIKQATPEDIKKFLEGHDDEKYIVSIELDQTGDWSIGQGGQNSYEDKPGKNAFRKQNSPRIINK